MAERLQPQPPLYEEQDVLEIQQQPSQPVSGQAFVAKA
jgi:hypothetical protein